MSDLIALSFPDPLRAEEVRVELMRLNREYLVDLEDAVVVVHREDGKVKLNQIHHLSTQGAIGGGFWGTLIGLIFLSPLVGLGIGAAAGAVTGALADVGIDDEFMRELGESLPPGSSALFILVRNARPDRVIEALEPYQGKVLRTSLSRVDEQRLEEALEAARSSSQS